MEALSELVTLADFEEEAKRILDPGVYGYYAGGADGEVTLKDNREAFNRWLFRPRVLVDRDKIDTRVSFAGADLALPLIVAPMAFQRMLNPEGELATAQAADKAGIGYCLSTLANSSANDVAAVATGGNNFFQLYCYKDKGVTRALVDQAVDTGFKALFLTVDLPPIGRRETEVRTGFHIPEDMVVPSFSQVSGGARKASPADIAAMCDTGLTWESLEELRTYSDLPLYLKGLLTSEDAELACEHEVDGIVVSNHGGRQLDYSPASLDVLPQIVEAVDGRIDVLIDGGFRRGTDVVKALALGAKAVLVGRPIAWGLATGGEAGVTAVLEMLADEFKLALALVGAGSVSGLDRSFVTPKK